MKNWLKYFKLINPYTFFKWLKRYMENKAEIESKLIDNEKQREHEKWMQNNELKHIENENEKQREHEKTLEIIRQDAIANNLNNILEKMDDKVITEFNNKNPHWLIRWSSCRKSNTGKKIK